MHLSSSNNLPIHVPDPPTPIIHHHHFEPPPTSPPLFDSEPDPFFTSPQTPINSPPLTSRRHLPPESPTLFDSPTFPISRFQRPGITPPVLFRIPNRRRPHSGFHSTHPSPTFLPTVVTFSDESPHPTPTSTPSTSLVPSHANQRPFFPAASPLVVLFSAWTSIPARSWFDRSRNDSRPYSLSNPWLLPIIYSSQPFSRIGPSSLCRGYHFTLTHFSSLVQRQALEAVSSATDALDRARLSFGSRNLLQLAYRLHQLFMSLVSRFTSRLQPSPDLNCHNPQQRSPTHTGHSQTKPLFPNVSLAKSGSSTRLKLLSAQLRPLLLPDAASRQNTSFTTNITPHAPPAHLYFQLNPPPLLLSARRTIQEQHHADDDSCVISPGSLSSQSYLDSVSLPSSGVSAPPGFAVLTVHPDSDSDSDTEDSECLFSRCKEHSVHPPPSQALLTFPTLGSAAYLPPYTPGFQTSRDSILATPHHQTSTGSHEQPLSSFRRPMSGRLPFPVAPSGNAFGTASTQQNQRPPSLLMSDSPVPRRARPATIFFHPSEGMPRRDTSLSSSSEGTSGSLSTRPSSSCATSVGQPETFAFPPKSGHPSGAIQMPIPPSPKKNTQDTPPASFLTLLAAQERKVLELRQQLEQAEAQLRTLKRTWTNEASKQKRVDRPRYNPPSSRTGLPGRGSDIANAAAAEIRGIHQPAATVSGLFDITGDTPQDRLNRRHSIMTAQRSHHRKIISGSQPRPLSLLTESPFPLSQFSIPEASPQKSESEERMSALAALEGRVPEHQSGAADDASAIESPSILAAASSGFAFSSACAPDNRVDRQMRRRPSSIQSYHAPGQTNVSPTITAAATTTASPKKEPPGSASLPRSSISQSRPPDESLTSSSSYNPPSLMTTARGVRDSLWTLFEDIKHVVSTDAFGLEEASAERSGAVYLPSHAHSFCLSANSRPKRSVSKELGGSDRESGANANRRTASSSSSSQTAVKKQQSTRHQPSPSLPPPSTSASMAVGLSRSSSSKNNRRRSMYHPAPLISPPASSKTYEQTSGDIDEWETWAMSHSPPEDAPILAHSAKHNDYGSLVNLSRHDAGKENDPRSRPNALGVLFEEDWR